MVHRVSHSCTTSTLGHGITRQGDQKLLQVDLLTSKFIVVWPCFPAVWRRPHSGRSRAPCSTSSRRTWRPPSRSRTAPRGFSRGSQTGTVKTNISQKEVKILGANKSSSVGSKNLKTRNPTSMPLESLAKVGQEEARLLARRRVRKVRRE